MRMSFACHWRKRQRQKAVPSPSKTTKVPLRLSKPESEQCRGCSIISHAFILFFLLLFGTSFTFPSFLSSFYLLHFIHPSFLPSCLIYFFFLSFFSFLPCLLACFLLSSSFVKFSVRQSFLVFEYYFNKPSASKRLVRFRTIPLTGLSDSSSAPNGHERSLVTCW